MDLDVEQLIETTEIVLLLALMWKVRKMINKKRAHRRRHPLGKSEHRSYILF
jgi:hypothetical protein